jgi:hypothetical protein
MRETNQPELEHLRSAESSAHASATRAESAFGGELAKRSNRGPLTLRDGHNADSGASEQTSRYRIPT